MNRVDFLDKLKLVAPALSDNTLVPVLNHFWFRGDRLLAYNDQIALSTPCKIDFKGAVPGSTLISLLSASRAKDVEFLVGKDANGNKLPEGQLLIKAASSRLKLPYLEEEATTLFDMPQPSQKDALNASMKDFLFGVETCLRSVQENTAIPDSLGITVLPRNKQLDLYATNDSTISHVCIELKAVPILKDRVVLSGAFCRQMVALAALSDKNQLEIHDDYSLFKSGDNLLFGRLVNVPKPLDFSASIESHYPVGSEDSLVAIPSKLQLVLERAIIITDSKTERSRTSIVIKDGKASFYSKSEKGEVRDSVLLEASHPDVEITIEPKLLKSGYGFFERMLFTETCAIMTKDNALYLIAAAQ